MAEEDVLRHGQVVGEVELLVHHGDAFRLRRTGTGEPGRLAVDAQFPASGRLVAGEDFHQRGLARTVLAEQTVNASRC